ncbi:MAG TPA: endolytic transglycosylase MltG [Acidimicrobiales bacterium]|nr:endolytic transglycosylase MltG [Acidimicrobiales bacterium]
MSEIFFDQDDERGASRGPVLAGDEGADDDPAFLHDDEDVRYVDDGGGGGRVGRVLTVLGVVAIVGLIGAALVGVWVQRQINPPGGPGEEIVLVIPEGSSTTAIGQMLEAEGVISDSQIFRFYLRFNGGGPFQAGEYQLARNMGMGDVVEVLERGPRATVAGRLTVPEGLVLDEIVQVIGRDEAFDADAFREVIEAGEVRSRYQPDGKPLEGLLFPETYTLDGREDEAVLLRRMVASFDATLDELGYAEAEQRVGLTPYEVVIVASLIEAEAKADEDRAKISRVIHNRLEEGMTLGIDATFYYALGRRGGSLTQSDLAIDSPYNTRQNAGLVPTPIGAPGRASLDAALNPEDGPWLYYVLKDPRVHSFSEDYNDFLRDRRAAQEAGLIP